MHRRPKRTTGVAMKGALQRVDDIASFRLGWVKLHKVLPNRLSALARYGLSTKAPKQERTSEPKRTAMPPQLVNPTSRTPPERATALANSEATLRLPAVSADSVREGRDPSGPGWTACGSSGTGTVWPRTGCRRARTA